MREVNQEEAVRHALEALGFESRKDGRDGYPDRLVLTGFCHHVWIEHKTKIGRLTPAQKIVFPRLEKRGDVVIYGRGLSVPAIVDAVRYHAATFEHCRARIEARTGNASDKMTIAELEVVGRFKI